MTLTESLMPDGPRQACVATLPDNPRNCGHPRLIMVSVFLCM
jgi:hypothetical protein